MLRFVLVSMLLIFSGLLASSMNSVSAGYEQRIHPVVAEVHFVAFRDEQLLEELADEEVVRPLVEPQGAHVVQHDAELDRQPLAEHLGQVRNLAVQDFLVLLALVRRVGSLPRQRALQEVHQHVAQRLQVVAPAQLDAEVRVDARVPGGPDEAAVFFVRDVVQGLRVSVLLGQVEVQDVHFGGALLESLPVNRGYHGEVLGLDISVDVVLVVHVFDPGQGLVRDHQGGLETEHVSAEDEEVVDGRAEQLFDEQVVVGVHRVCAGPEVEREAVWLSGAYLPRTGSGGWPPRAGAGPRFSCLRF